nr:uncharacterized protein LOC105731203 [Aotus nancymaae]
MWPAREHILHTPGWAWSAWQLSVLAAGKRGAAAGCGCGWLLGCGLLYTLLCLLTHESQAIGNLSTGLGCDVFMFLGAWLCDFRSVCVRGTHAWNSPLATGLPGVEPLCIYGGLGGAPMWGVVTQLPVRALGLGVHVWGLYLHLLSLGLRAFLLCILVLLRELCVCVRETGRAVFTAARSVALMAHACSVYVFLQGVAWAAQLVGSCVTLPIWLYCALLETLRCVPLLPLCEEVAGWLVWAGMQAGRGLARVWGVATFVQLCAHTVFLGMYLCMHICFAAISSKVRVRVHAPFCVSLPFRVHAPLNLGIKVGLQGRKQGRATGEASTPQRERLGKQKPQTSRSPKPTRREVSRSRRELSPGE